MARCRGDTMPFPIVVRLGDGDSYLFVCCHGRCAAAVANAMCGTRFRRFTPTPVPFRNHGYQNVSFWIWTAPCGYAAPWRDVLFFCAVVFAVSVIAAAVVVSASAFVVGCGCGLLLLWVVVVVVLGVVVNRRCRCWWLPSSPMLLLWVVAG